MEKSNTHIKLDSKAIYLKNDSRLGSASRSSSRKGSIKQQQQQQIYQYQPKQPNYQHHQSQNHHYHHQHQQHHQHSQQHQQYNNYTNNPMKNKSETNLLSSVLMNLSVNGNLVSGGGNSGGGGSSSNGGGGGVNNSSSTNSNGYASKQVEDSITRLHDLNKQMNNIIVNHINSTSTGTSNSTNKSEKGGIGSGSGSGSGSGAISHDKDYINGFKFVNLAIQKELEALKRKIHDTMPIKQDKDDRIKELEYQVQYYKGEANRFYNATDNNIRIIQELRKKYKDASNERDYLRNKLQEVSSEFDQVKKEYLYLLQEVSRYELKNQQYGKESPMYEQNQAMIQEGLLQRIQLESYKTNQNTDDMSMANTNISPKMMLNKHNLIMIRILQDYFEKHKNPERMVEEMIEYIRSIEEEKNVTIEKLKSLLNKEMKEKQMLNEYISATLSEISDYEILFVECVKAVKDQINQRVLNQGNNGENGSHGSSISGGASGMNGGNNPSNGLSLINDYDLKSFMDEDKAKILELFVSTERVMLGIYELMFPNNKFDINSYIKPLNVEKKNSKESGEKDDLGLNTSDVIDENEILQGDKSEFNQSYHFENLMLLKKNKLDLQKIISAPVSAKHSRKSSADVRLEHS